MPFCQLKPVRAARNVHIHSIFWTLVNSLTPIMLGVEGKLGRIEEGKTVGGMQCMKKEQIFKNI